MQMEKPSHCLVSVSLSLHQVRMVTEASKGQRLLTFYSSSALKLTVWYAALCADVKYVRAGKSDMSLIGTGKNRVGVVKQNMEMIWSFQTFKYKNQEFKSLKWLKYSCKIMQFLSVLLLPSYKAQVIASCLYINFTVFQKPETVSVKC